MKDWFYDVIIRWYFMKNWFYNFKLKYWEKLGMWHHFMKDWFYDFMLKFWRKKTFMLTFQHKVQKSVILIFHLEFYQTVPPFRHIHVNILTESPKISRFHLSSWVSSNYPTSKKFLCLYFNIKSKVDRQQSDVIIGLTSVDGFWWL